MGMVADRRTARTNPCHSCQPLGIIYLTLGVQGGISLVHGSEGCCGLLRFLLERHFRNAARVTTTFFYEAPSISGRQNLTKVIRKIAGRYHPQFISVVGTCFTEPVGEDIENLILETGAVSTGKAVAIVPLGVPDRSGTYVSGYDAAAKTVLERLAEPRGNRHGRINVIPGVMNPGDIEEVKRILDTMGVPFGTFFDLSETLDLPLEESAAWLSGGGTLLSDLAEAPDGAGTIALCQHAGGAGAVYLQRKFNVPYFVNHLPVGLTNTDRFIDSLRKLAGVGVPPSLEGEREALVAAIADAHRYTAGKKAAVAGDPDTALALARFVCELGMEPAVVMSNTPSELFVREIEAIGREHGHRPNTISGCDLGQFEMALQDRGAQIVFGPSYVAKIAANTGIPLVRVGFPVYDHFSYYRWPILGYRGSLRLLSFTVDTILGFVPS